MRSYFLEKKTKQRILLLYCRKICNIENLGCPSLGELKEGTACSYHTEKGGKNRCALENTRLLKEWFIRDKLGSRDICGGDNRAERVGDASKSYKKRASRAARPIRSSRSERKDIRSKKLLNFGTIFLFLLNISLIFSYPHVAKPTQRNRCKVLSPKKKMEGVKTWNELQDNGFIKNSN